MKYIQMHQRAIPVKSPFHQKQKANFKNPVQELRKVLDRKMKLWC
jgi:hypothetical protein